MAFIGLGTAEEQAEVTTVPTTRGTGLSNTPTSYAPVGSNGRSPGRCGGRLEEGQVSPWVTSFHHCLSVCRGTKTGDCVYMLSERREGDVSGRVKTDSWS